MTRRPNHTTVATQIALCLLLGLSACGSSNSKSASSTTQSVSTTHDDPIPVGEDSTPDRDADNDGTGTYDQDDNYTLEFGHPASHADATQIAALVHRYYADAGRGDGAAACELLYSTYAEAVPEDYGTSPPGPPWARGKTCPEVLDHVFAHFEGEIALRLPMLKVESVRTAGHEGVALLHFQPGFARRELRVSREGHRWRVLSLIDSRLP